MTSTSLDQCHQGEIAGIVNKGSIHFSMKNLNVLYCAVHEKDMDRRALTNLLLDLALLGHNGYLTHPIGYLTPIH